MMRQLGRIRAQIQAHTKTAVIGASAVAVLSAGAMLAVSGGTASGSPDSGHQTTREAHSKTSTKTNHPRHAAPGAEPVHRPDGATLTLSQLPNRPELGEWTAVQGDGPVLVCVPEDVMEGLTPQATQTADFGAYGVDSTGTGPFAARIGEQVLEFSTQTAASDAMQSLASWLQDCAARDLNRPLSIESKTVTGQGHGFWETYLRSADAVCTECDAIYFDRQALVRTGNRLVLISLNEIGGPLQPAGLSKTMAKLVHAAVTMAAA